MSLPFSSPRRSSSGYTLVEMLCALALLSLLALSLVPLQQNILNVALRELAGNTSAQYLDAIQQRLRLYLYDSVEVSVLENIHRLKVARQFTDGLREYTYYLDPERSVFYEHAEYRVWTGTGSKPGAYTTPIASEITAFHANLYDTPQGVLVYISYASGERKREMTVLIRNTAAK